MSTNSNETPQLLATCPIYMAIVVDESGSIDSTEAEQIRQGLRNFINNQIHSSITLSLIGMSYSDNDIRTDHIIEKTISSNSALFVTWINAYGNRWGNIGINSNSDYWASGLLKSSNLGTANLPSTITPDIVIVITDGLQNNSDSLLINLFRDINYKSHIFVYGIKKGYYGAGAALKGESLLKDSLEYYLGRSPIERSSTQSILQSDYDSNINDFSDLQTALNNLATELATAHIGCISNVEITESHLDIPSLTLGIPVSASAGFLKLKNKSRVPLLNVPNNELIHILGQINGLTFTLDLGSSSTINIGANQEVSVNIKVSGTPQQPGNSTPVPIAINRINNIKDYKIAFFVNNAPTPNIIVIQDVTTSLTAGASYPHIGVTSIRLKNTSNTTCNLISVKIHLSPTIAGGLVFTASGSIPANTEKDVTVFVDYAANQALTDYSELIVMSIPGFTVSTAGHILKLNVAPEPINAKIKSTDDLSYITYTRGIAWQPPLIRQYGKITVENNSYYSSVFIYPGTELGSEMSNHFVFKTANTEVLEIPAGLGKEVEVNISFLPDFTMPSVSDDFEIIINLTSVHVDNPGNNYKIKVKVEDEAYNAVIVNTELSKGLFYKGILESFTNREYGFIEIENKTQTRDLEIGEVTFLNIQGFSFTTVAETIAKMETKKVFIRINASPPVVPQQTGSFFEKINITNPDIQNPQNYVIGFNVDDEPIVAQIVDSQFLPDKIFYKGFPNDIDEDYGYITIQNHTLTRPLRIIGDVTLFSENNFSFKILGGISIAAQDSEDFLVRVIAQNTAESVNNRYQRPIFIQDVFNRKGEHKLRFTITDEAYDIQVTGVEISQPLEFIQGLIYKPYREINVNVLIHNYTKTREFTIVRDTLVFPDTTVNPTLNGLIFKTKNTITVGKESDATIAVVVSSESGAINTGPFSFPIDLTPEVVNPGNQFIIPFRVIADNLSVEIIGAYFDYPPLRKGNPIINSIVGNITIENSSWIQEFVIHKNTTIHLSSNLAGLTFKTPNVDIVIPVRDSSTIDIHLESLGLSGPSDFGNFKAAIYINGVINNSNDGLPYMIDFDVLNNGVSVETEEDYSLQSPNFALQAVGSKGLDSPKSIQLRWLFSGQLGELHIPKADQFNDDPNNYNYNKPDDYVNVYRAPYVAQTRTIFNFDLLQGPFLLDNAHYCWIYKTSNATTEDETPAKFTPKERIMYVYFRNKFIYDQVIISIDPFRDPQGFIDAYGENIIEIECKEELFFRVQPDVNSRFSGTIYFEVLSAEENKLISSKYLSFRKKMTPRESKQTKILAENGRSIRYKTDGIKVYSFNFEFYSDFISTSSAWDSWEMYGGFGLVPTQNVKILNGILGDINGRWKRYNGDDYVRKQNYIDKWMTPSSGPALINKTILEILERYLLLSEQELNPRAEEYLDINFGVPIEIADEEIPNDDNGGTLVSYLDLLNVAGMDYHIARLLGLGLLDVNPDLLNGEEYIYMTEYKTLKDPNDVSINKNCQLLSMSLPTSVNTERLPIAVEINQLYKGIPNPQNDDIPVLYDTEGYTLDGKNRFISIINKPVPSYESNPEFFPNEVYWNASLYSLPVYAGLEYSFAIPGNNAREGWVRPELSHSDDYFNFAESAVVPSLETVPIFLPEKYGDPLFVHRQMVTGNYKYATYGINIFSRASSISTGLTIATTIKPANTLLPPSGVKTWLVQPEKPLMFTSQFEQDKYQEIDGSDKTLVRLNFNYNSNQDLITYPIPFNSPIRDSEYLTNPNHFPDTYDIFANFIEVYFRKDTPEKISARLYKVDDDDLGDKLCVMFRTKSYYLASTGETLQSVYPLNTSADNFIGSVFIVNNKSYVVKSVKQGAGSDGLTFTVYKEEVSQTILAGGSIAINFNSLTKPYTSGNDLFVITENMQSSKVWGDNYNPNLFTVPLNFPGIHREMIYSLSERGEIQKYLEKSRGYWDTATIAKDQDEFESRPFTGIYKIVFDNLKLEREVFQTDEAFAEIANGMVRAFRETSFSGIEPKTTRDQFKVVRAENFGLRSRLPFTLYVYDELMRFDTNGTPIESKDIILEGSDILINYYPSYNVYLYNDIRNNLTSTNVLPQDNSYVKYSIFGLRSVDTDNRDSTGYYKSRFSAPSLMAGQKVIVPLTPELPKGSFYATRPDFYGRSTYSFTTIFNQEPYGAQFSRTDNNAILSALYEPRRLAEIYEGLSLVGGNEEEFLKNRWDNFFDFKFLKDAVENPTGMYASFPVDKGGHTGIPIHNAEIVNGEGEFEIANLSYAFPLPNSTAFFNGINKFISDYNFNNNQTIPPLSPRNYGNILLSDVIIPSLIGVNDVPIYLADFIEEVVNYTFVPLTEMPVIYQFIKKLPYLPLDKKQNIRDNSGFLLKPLSNPNKDENFDMAPMMTIIDQPANKVLFTDFKLNGTTNNIYFYAVREVGSQMKMSEMSPILGPVKLVNSNPSETPKILSGLPILENKTLGVGPKIKVEIQPYPEFVGIKRIKLYRADNRLDAESILSMKLIKEIDISEIELSIGTTWVIYDELLDFEQVPYGDTLYYRIVVEKKIQYAEYDNGNEIVKTDFVPSQPSKILALMLVETQNPETPLLEGTGIRPVDADYVNNIAIQWNVTSYKGIYHLYSMSTQGNWKEIARFVSSNNNKVRLQIFSNNIWENREILNIVDSKISLSLGLISNDYNQFPLFDQNNNRIYYHFKVIAENTSNMFSTEDKILTLFSDDIWNSLTGISSDGSSGMIIGKTFIIK